MIDYQEELEREKLRLEELKARQAKICDKIIYGLPIFILGVLSLALSVELRSGFGILISCVVGIVGFVIAWKGFIHSDLQAGVAVAKFLSFHSLHFQISESIVEIGNLKRKLEKDLEHRKDYYEAKGKEAEDVFNPVTTLTDDQVLEIMERAKKIEQPGVQNAKKEQPGEAVMKNQEQTGETVKNTGEITVETAEDNRQPDAGDDRKKNEEETISVVDYL